MVSIVSIETLTEVLRLMILRASEERLWGLNPQGSRPRWGTKLCRVLETVIPALHERSTWSQQIKKQRDGIFLSRCVNGDSFTDIVVHVTTEALQLTQNDVSVALKGQLMNGTVIKGSDSVKIAP